MGKKNGIKKMPLSRIKDMVKYGNADWTKVPFGTKVRAWWEDSKVKYTGRFLAYDDDDTELPFLVFIEHIPDTNWYGFCEIIEEGEDE